MTIVRFVALVSTLALTACGGGGGASSGGASATGFETKQPATLTLTTVARSPLGSTAMSSNGEVYNPKTGRISSAIAYTGPVAEGEWRTGAGGDRMRMTNPAGTKFVRQVDIVEAREDKIWHRGVIGFETERMPRTGKVTYNGTTSGQVMKFGYINNENPSESFEPTTTDFDGSVKVQADLGSGKGNIRVSNVRSSDGRSKAPFRSLSSDITIDGSRIYDVDDAMVLDSGRGQPLGEAWSTRTSGAIFGPNAEEIGGGYLVRSENAIINGGFVAKR